MPTKARRLKEEALQACKNRGHEMNKFYRPYISPVTSKLGRSEKYWRSSCAHCHMGVQVNLHVLPNEIDISGEAVALNCTKGKK